MKQLGIEIRKKVMELHEKGFRHKEISRNLCVTQNTVVSIVQDFGNLSGTRGKKETSARINAIIVREVQKGRRISAPKIAAEMEFKFRPRPYADV
ncbi:hypothetical protein Trydic_g1199 [Trypoxylus dichotomus]